MNAHKRGLREGGVATGFLWWKESAWLMALVVLCLMCGCSRKPLNELVIGMELNYPPFEMTDEHGQPAGVSVDLAEALGKYLGRDVRIENTPFDGLIPSLNTGRIDLIISSMTATLDRAQSIDFSDPYLTTGLCLLISKNSPARSIKSLDQPDRVLAVKSGTTAQTFAAQHIKQAHVLVLDQENACVLEVVEGKADAFIYDQMSTYQNWRHHEDTTIALLKPFQEEHWAIGIRKGNTVLLGQVNQFLKDFRARNGFDELGDRYLKEQKEAFRKLGYPFYF
jgi:polar amino acid transport system substrate-binding protein